MTDKKEQNNNKERVGHGVLQALALTTTIGTEIAIAVAAGYFGGRYLDSLFNTGPWLLLVGVLSGLAVGVMGIYVTLMKFLKE
ncbi:MAG: AtpZ/AtpI family protein [Pelotomaculum sp.]|jgi:ATP synthase protein I